MVIRLMDIGDSKGVKIPQHLIKKYELEKKTELKPINRGLFISKKKKAREGWENQIKSAIAQGDLPDNDSFENLNNKWDNFEWTWPE